MSEDEIRQRAARLREAEKVLSQHEARLLHRAHDLNELQSVIDGWPVIVRALNRKGILTAADLNDMRFPDHDKTLMEHLGRAMTQTFQSRDDKKKRPDEG